MTTLEHLWKAFLGYVPVRREEKDFKASAVLVPVVERQGRAYLVFTLRPDSMPTHGGQISFPGGRHDARDVDLRATALREAKEEIGVDLATVEIVGELDDEITPFQFIITPVVAYLGDPAPFRPNPREVVKCFEFSLETLAHPDSHVDRGQHEFAGRVYRLPEYRINGHVIWGATARMVERLLALLGDIR